MFVRVAMTVVTVRLGLPEDRPPPSSPSLCAGLSSIKHAHAFRSRCQPVVNADHSIIHSGCRTSRIRLAGTESAWLCEQMKLQTLR
jgi:hypothetical protein